MSQRRAEALGAAFWAVLGATIFVASWRMDRLEHQGIAPASAPGLLPGLIGALMVVFALVLAWRAWRPARAETADHDTADDDAADDGEPPGAWRGSALATLLCLVFAGISLGHGLPFQLEAAIFIAAFTAAFRWREWRAESRIARGLAETTAIAVVSALAIGWLFESVFLVRLP